MNTVIYDGECKFCIARVKQVQAMDTGHSMEYIPRQDPATEERFPMLKDIKLDDGIVFIGSNGRLGIAADAMYEIARLLPSTKRFAWLYQVPVLKQIAQLGYRLVAINRKRLGQTCAGNVCQRPD